MSCPDCFSGTEHLGNPKGTIDTIHGLETYVARPADGVTPKGIVVYIPDAFGMHFINNKILADHYAKRGGFLVYLPDFMNGYSCPTSILPLMHNIMKPAGWFTTLFYKPFWALKTAILMIPWAISARTSVTKPRVFNFFQALRTSPPPFSTSNLKIGAAGFCWGGRYTVLLATDTPSSRVARHSSQTTTGLQPLIDCAFTAHPSGLDMPKDIEAVTVPLSVSIGNEDMTMKGSVILQMKEILEVKKKGDHEVVILPGARHGFAVRTDTSDSLQMEHAETAEKQAVNWFARWFA